MWPCRITEYASSPYQRLPRPAPGFHVHRQRRPATQAEVRMVPETQFEVRVATVVAIALTVLAVVG